MGKKTREIMQKISMGISILQGIANTIFWLYAVNYMLCDKFDLPNGIGLAIYLGVNIVIALISSGLLCLGTREG